MKRIFIASHSMEIGGVERSLIGLLNSIDYSKYKVDLLLYKHQGEFMNLIPKEVNLLPEDKSLSSLTVPIKECIKKGCMDILVGRIIGKVLAYLYNKGNNIKESYVAIEYSHKYTKRFIRKINTDIKYDLAISFLTPHYIVAEKINANKKVAWIHTDYKNIFINSKSEFKMWDQYDYIASISTSCSKAFVDKFPKLKKKIIEVENILSPEFVRQQANEGVAKEIDQDSKITTICTVGRFCNPKGFDKAIQICKLIVEKGIQIRWYAIGYGPDEHKMRELIHQNSLEGVFIILGKKTNPYPYMKACDLYIQPSRYEGKAVAVREAQILCRPTIITNFETASSQLIDGVDGVIIPMETTQAANAIINVIRDKALQERLIKQMVESNYGNEKEVEKIYTLMV